MTISLNKGSIYLISAVILAIILIAGVFVYYFLINSSEPLPPIDNTLIRVTNPQPDQDIESPIVVSGKAKGYWFFEGTFPVKLLDENGNIITQTFAQAKGDWMTEDFVEFESVLTFTVSKNQKGTLILEKDNPSGLPENAKEIKIPVNLKTSETKTGQLRTVPLYYYNPKLDKDGVGNILCSKNGLVPVDRQIPITNTPIQDTINLLISGKITPSEKLQGITTEYPLQGFELIAASLNNSVLTLTFNDPNNKTSGGACRVGVLWFQIEATAKQFIGVSSVKFMPAELFQP